MIPNYELSNQAWVVLSGAMCHGCTSGFDMGIETSQPFGNVQLQQAGEVLHVSYRPGFQGITGFIGVSLNWVGVVRD